MRLLLLGCSGFVGRDLVPFLLELGHQITLVSRREAPFPASLSDRLVFLRLDPSDPASWRQESLRQALAAASQKSGDAVCHLGAPNRLGDQIAALPISASAPMVSEVADRIAKGVSFERAFAPIQRDIDTLFAKMGRIMG